MCRTCRPWGQVNTGATTQFAYLGLSSELTSETGGPVPKSYTYTPDGERTSQTSTTGTTTSTGYYTYNDHADVEALTGSRSSGGTTTATYGYTAYGQPAAAQFTGADKNTISPSPTAQLLPVQRDALGLRHRPVRHGLPQPRPRPPSHRKPQQRTLQMGLLDRPAPSSPAPPGVPPSCGSSSSM